MTDVVAIHVAKPGMREDVLREVAKFLPYVRAEPRCVSYVPPSISEAAQPRSRRSVRMASSSSSAGRTRTLRKLAPICTQGPERLAIADAMQSRTFFAVKEQKASVETPIGSSVDCDEEQG